MTEPSEIGIVDSGFAAVCAIAGFYRVSADPVKVARDLAVHSRRTEPQDLVRAARALGLKGRLVTGVNEKRLVRLPTPAIVKLRDGGFVIFGGLVANDLYRVVDPVARVDRAVSISELLAFIEPIAVLVARPAFGPGVNPRTFGFKWFWPSLIRYRKPLGEVLLASLFIQIFALVSPLFFQVVVDKVLAHKGYSTLFVLVIGLVLIGLFDVILKYLRTYALSHTTNRIDVELGMRLFRHLLRLPIAYFETRATGQTVARLSELETIRAFLTGQGLFSALDFVFAFVLLAVLFVYSWKLAFIVLCTIPFVCRHRLCIPSSPARRHQ